MRRYLIRKLITYVLAFFVGVSIDWGIPHLIPGDPIQGLLSRFRRPGSGVVRGALQDVRPVVRPQRAALAAVPGLLEGPADREHGDQHLRRPEHGHVARLRGDAVHPGAARPGRGALLHRREPAGRGGRAAQGARQHRPPARVHLPGHPVPVAGAGGAVPARRGLARVPDRRRLLGDAAARLELDVHREPARPLVPAVPHRVHREPRRLGHRHAQPGHLRARERQLAVPARAGRKRAGGPPVRVPQRVAAAALRPGAGTRRGHRRQHRHRDRVRLPRPRPPDLRRDHEPGLLPPAGHLHLHRHRRPDRQLHHRPGVHHASIRGPG